MPLKGKPPEKAKPRKPRILVYGKGGVGKTWCALDWPNVYYIDTEGSASLPHYAAKLAKSNGAYLGIEDGACDMDFIVNEVRALAVTPHNYKTLVIDSYTRAFFDRITEEEANMEAKGDDMSATFGREKKPAVRRSSQLVKLLKDLDMNVLIICHEKDKWEGKGKDRTIAGTTFDGHEKLEYDLDLVLNVFKAGQSRRARVGKTRLEQFKEGDVFDWTYEQMAKRLGHELIESEFHPTSEPSTAEQVDTVKRLAKIVNLPVETREKWFNKAAVDSWEEMDARTINGCISYLKKKIGVEDETDE